MIIMLLVLLPTVSIKQMIYILLVEQEVSTAADFEKNVYFDLTNKLLGRGYSYVIKADVVWNDNYEDHHIEISSDTIQIKKKNQPLNTKF